MVGSSLWFPSDVYSLVGCFFFLFFWCTRNTSLLAFFAFFLFFFFAFDPSNKKQQKIFCKCVLITKKIWHAVTIHTSLNFRNFLLRGYSFFHFNTGESGALDCLMLTFRHEQKCVLVAWVHFLFFSLPFPNTLLTSYFGDRTYWHSLRKLSHLCTFFFLLLKTSTITLQLRSCRTNQASCVVDVWFCAISAWR